MQDHGKQPCLKLDPPTLQMDNVTKRAIIKKCLDRQLHLPRLNVGSQEHRKSGQNDIVKVAGIDGEGFPINDDGMKRW